MRRPIAGHYPIPSVRQLNLRGGIQKRFLQRIVFPEFADLSQVHTDPRAFVAHSVAADACTLTIENSGAAFGAAALLRPHCNRDQEQNE